ncbi:metallophosphoesterase [uncultured Friedmanniella sp.]|uniref:metallophosphoesterase n=1 Tax=uncultured Friedmanniella sp. TaxID=335381 RepID=UPI0035CA9B11
MTLPLAPGRRVAVIGDVAGHLDELVGELDRLGADPSTGLLPPNLVVIQVGDLVHRGPDSAGVVALVDRYLTEQPEQWLQLVGNHEAQYLREPAFDWPEQLPDEVTDTLRRWWEAGQLRVAAALTTRAESYLVTHAGLTAGFWRAVLDAPPDARQAALALNALPRGRRDVVFRAGELLGRRRDQSAGPLWAVASTELVPSWQDSLMPFSQVHGHTSVYDWANHRFAGGPATTPSLTELDEEAKHAVVSLRGGRIIGVDPGHGEQPRRPWRSWELSLP